MRRSFIYMFGGAAILAGGSFTLFRLSRRNAMNNVVVSLDKAINVVNVRRGIVFSYDKSLLLKKLKMRSRKELILLRDFILTVVQDNVEEYERLGGKLFKSVWIREPYWKSFSSIIGGD